MESSNQFHQAYNQQLVCIDQSIKYAKKALNAYIQATKQKTKIQSELYDLERTKNSLKRTKDILSRQLDKLSSENLIYSLQIQQQIKQVSGQEQLLQKQKTQTDILCQLVAKQDNYLQNLNKDKAKLCQRLDQASSSQWELLTKIAESIRQVFILHEAIEQIQTTHKQKNQGIIKVQQDIKKITHQKQQKHAINQKLSQENQQLQNLCQELQQQILKCETINQGTNVQIFSFYEKMKIEKQIQYELQEKYKIVANRSKRLNDKNQRFLKFKQRNENLGKAHLLAIKQRKKQIHGIKDKVQTIQAFYERYLHKRLQMNSYHSRSVSNISD